MFPVRYELNSYINLLRNSVFKGLKLPHIFPPLAPVQEVPRLFLFREVKGNGKHDTPD
jgi:hypothetical protein